MKIIYDQFTLRPRQVWYNGGMRNFMNNKELFKKNIIEACVNGNILLNLLVKDQVFQKDMLRNLNNNLN